MKRLLLLCAVVVFSLAALAQRSVEGVWLGSLQVNAMSLRVAFHISKGASGYTATMDSIDQGARGIPVTSVSLEGDTLTIRMDALGGQYKGKLNAAADSIEGTWSQGGSQLPLVLKRTTEQALEQRRPQNPTKPYPYHEEDVKFENKGAGITLAGTLTTPSGKGPFTAVVLITGSGPQNRDEELFGHRPFLVLSDYLTRKGIAVLRVDDRGVGQSQGKFAEATTADFATDTEAAVAYLKTRPEINAKRIGLLGHSEGALIAPMIAARNSDVAFVVLLAAPGLPGDAVIPAQARAIAKASGATDAVADQEAQHERDTFAIVEASKDPATLPKQLHDKLITWMPEERVNAEIAVLTSQWFRNLLTYDPATALRKVKCPVFVLNGALDIQVLPSQNLPPIRKALEEAGNKHFDIEEMPGLNHLFQTAKTGSVTEYGQIEETMSPLALDKIATWIQKQ